MTDKDDRISEIVNRLDSLTLEANTLTHELRELRRQDRAGATHGREGNEGDERQQQRNNEPVHAHGFSRGERVVITNLYTGRRGTEGTVTHTTRTQVTLRDGTGRTHVRKYTNVRKL